MFPLPIVATTTTTTIATTIKEDGVSDLKKHREEECEEEECIAVKGCRKGRPVKVRLEEDCDPISVSIEQKHCEPLVVKLKQEHCEPLQVHIKGKPHVHQAEGDCWHVQGCKDGEPINVNVVNTPPPPTVQNDQFVFNGTSWEPLLTPSKFVPVNNSNVTGPTAIWTPAPGTRFRFMGFQLSSTLAGQVLLRDGFGGPIIDTLIVQLGVPYQGPPLGNGILSIAVGNPLVLEFVGGPGTANVTGLVLGQEVP